MSTWTDDQHTTFANARLEWFQQNQPTWVCAGCHDRVVEYAPEHVGDPCDHTAYCAGCAREHVWCSLDDRWTFRDLMISIASFRCICGDAMNGFIRIGGPGAQSYAAHVAAGTLR